MAAGLRPCGSADPLRRRCVESLKAGASRCPSAKPPSQPLPSSPRWVLRPARRARETTDRGGQPCARSSRRKSCSSRARQPELCRHRAPAHRERPGVPHSGKVAERLVQTGDRVTAGQPLARLDAADLCSSRSRPRPRCGRRRPHWRRPRPRTGASRPCAARAGARCGRRSPEGPRGGGPWPANPRGARAGARRQQPGLRDARSQCRRRDHRGGHRTGPGRLGRPAGLQDGARRRP